MTSAEVGYIVLSIYLIAICILAAVFIRTFYK
jgi:hypothetical protein